MAVEFEPCAVGAGRAVILAPRPTALNGLKGRMTESAGHAAVEGADGRLGVVAQQIHRRLLVVDGLVGHSPAVQEEVVLMVVQEELGQGAIGPQGLQSRQVHGAAVDVGGIPLVEAPPGGERFARDIRAPSVVAQLDQWRACAGGGEAAADRAAEGAGRVQAFLPARVPDLVQDLPEQIDAGIEVRLAEGPDAVPGPVIQRRTDQSGGRSALSRRPGASGPGTSRGL